LKWGERMYEPELMALINAATDASLSQRYARDKMLEQQNFQQQAIQQYRPLRRDFDNSRLTGVAGGKAHRVRHYKEPALACPNGVLHETVKLKSGKHWCQECAKVLERDGGLSL
jgi:hypothetical protein